MSAPPLRLAVLLTHPVQYFKPVFQALAASDGVELMVFFGCDHGLIPSHDPDFGVAFAWDSSPSQGFPHQFLSHAPLAALSSARKGLPLATKACRQIRAWGADAVLIFAYSPLFITASSYCCGPKAQTGPTGGRPGKVG